MTDPLEALRALPAVQVEEDLDTLRVTLPQQRDVFWQTSRALIFVLLLVASLVAGLLFAVGGVALLTSTGALMSGAVLLLTACFFAFVGFTDIPPALVVELSAQHLLLGSRRIALEDIEAAACTSTPDHASLLTLSLPGETVKASISEQHAGGPLAQLIRHHAARRQAAAAAEAQDDGALQKLRALQAQARP